jgi:anti-sigma B factor antagonist
MRIDLREIGSVSVVDLDGNLTIGHGDVRLREVFSEILRSDRRHVLLNLRGVQYMDSAGIGELVACSKRARDSNVALKLLHPSAKVREMLEITRFADLFETFDDEQAAMRSF